MSSLPYLGSKLASICTVLVGSLASICTALASSSILKMPDIGGITGLSGVVLNQRLSSLSLVAMTAVAASSMLSYSQSSAHCVLASMMMIPVGLGILILRKV
jgi:hypothetical protein